MKWHVTPHAIHVNIYTRDGVTSIMLLKRMVCTVWIRWMVRCWSILFILLIILLLGGYEWMWESMQSILLGKDKLFLWEEEVLIRYLVWVVITHQLLSAKHFGPSLSNTHGIVVLHGFTRYFHYFYHDGQTAFFPFFFSPLFSICIIVASVVVARLGVLVWCFFDHVRWRDWGLVAGCARSGEVGRWLLKKPTSLSFIPTKENIVCGSRVTKQKRDWQS